jgi:hypothetical protein
MEKRSRPTGRLQIRGSAIKRAFSQRQSSFLPQLSGVSNMPAGVGV